MAKPSFYQHRKFKKLVRVLGIPAPYVAGLMEFLWLSAYSTGDAAVGDVEDIELVAEWPGKPGEFAKALELCGLIDRTVDGSYEIHDLLDHAPEYVTQRAKRRVIADPNRPCDECGKPVGSGNARTRFCSANCRLSAHRRRAVPSPETGSVGAGFETVETVSETVETVETFETVPLQQTNRTNRANVANARAAPSADGDEGDSAEEFLAAWNASGMPKAMKMSDARRRLFRTRVKDRDWRESWRAALARAAKSSFLLGLVPGKTWRADINWFLSPDSVTFILEGKYDDRATAPGSSQETRGGVKPGQDPAEMIESAFANLEAKFGRGKK